MSGCLRGGSGLGKESPGGKVVLCFAPSSALEVAYKVFRLDLGLRFLFFKN